MKFFISLLLLTACYASGYAQDRRTLITRVETMLLAGVDKKGANPLTGIEYIRFTGDTLHIRTSYFTLEYPRLDISKLIEVKPVADGSPTGLLTIWLYFSEEQVRRMDGTESSSVKQFSVYILPKHLEEFKQTLLLLREV